MNRLFWGDPDGETFSLGRELFLRLVGLAAFFASVSLATQVEALYGTQGILPFVEYLDWAREVAAGDRTAMLVRAPTLLWLQPTDGMLVGLAWTSAVASLLLFWGLAPRLTIPVIWLSYGSIVGVGRVFLSFQWDVLLLETLVVAWLIASWNLVMRPRPLGSGRVGHHAGRFLLFKLMFLAGWVKVASGDPAWSGEMDALTYHFWTQPLPTWTAYYADKLPEILLVGATLLTVVIELVAPFGIWAPRRVRHAAALALVALQLAIAATGNYGFFNLLTLALCALLFDDKALRRLPFADRLFEKFADRTPPELPDWRRRLGVVVAVAVIGASAIPLLDKVAPSTTGWIGDKARLALQTTRSFNSYGLFARMTKDRREIGIELSRDGDEWEPIEFAWKPDRLDERPRFAGPHMPRLDWQMWFAGLGDCRRNVWLVYAAREVMQENSLVADLFESVPAGSGWRYVRFPSHQYRFADDGWWRRDDAGPYCPPLELVDGQLRPAAGARTR